MPDITTQRGTSIIATSATTVTITAGTEYTAPASNTAAFIRIVGTHLTGASETDASYGADTWGVSIQNPSNLVTSVIFERWDADATNTAQVDWEIIEYTGAASGANEFIVREQEEINRLSSSDSIVIGAVSGIVTDADVVVFITGQRANQTSGFGSENQHISQWNSGDDTATFLCFRSNAREADISYAVVEYTGSNWVIQRALHTYTAAGTDETETLTTLGSTGRTCIHVQYRQNGNNSDDQGHQVRITSTTAVTFFIDSGAAFASLESVAWVIENTQTDGTPMVVTQYSSTDAGGGDFTTTLSPTVTVAESSVTGECATLDLSTPSQPRQIARFRITSSSVVTGNRESSSGTSSFRFEVTEWPTVAAAAEYLPLDQAHTPQHQAIMAH